MQFRTKIRILSLLYMGWCALLGCTENSFSGSSNSSGAGSRPSTGSGIDPSASGNEPTEQISSGECIDGDKIDFQFENTKIQECIDAGKMWNFDLNVCTAMKKASFACTFDEFFIQMEKRGMAPSSLLRDGQEQGALIIACGESDDEETILLQWFFKPEGYQTKCHIDKVPGNVITGCYGKDGDDPNGLSDSERKKVVLECMNRNRE